MTPTHAASKLPQEGVEAAAFQKHPLAARQVPEVVNVVQAAAAAAHEAATGATAGTATVTAGTASDALTGAT